MLDVKLTPDQAYGNLPAAAMIADSTGRISYVNKATLELLDMPKSHLLKQHSKNIGIALLDESGADIPLAHMPGPLAARSGVITQRKICKLRLQDGRLKHVLVSAQPIKPGVAVCFITDLTAVYKADLARLQMELATEQAEKAEATFDKFTERAFRNYSHELNTALSLVAGYPHILLLDDTLSPDAQRHIKTIQKAADSLKGIVSTILMIQELDTWGPDHYKHEVFYYSQLVTDCIKKLSAEFEAKGIQLNTNALESGIHVYGASWQIEKAILAILDNTIKFNKKHGRVTVTLRQEPGRRGWPNQAVLVISDSGMGIPQRKVSQIWQAFNQIDGSMTRTHGGVGNGLRLAKLVIEEHHQGTITVHSTPGRGTRFWIYLPQGK